MNKLILSGILKLSPFCPIDTSKPVPNSFDSNSFFQYHHQSSHEIQRCFALNNFIQDLIASNAISTDVEVNSMNKYGAPSN